ncbi:MAG: homogentisate phytyltransferase [Methanobacteriota archaeon]|nr:MAG: homogentisate phytyltransferase [Euryarchaeota archaeon]
MTGKISALIRFSRPHTVIGTILSITTLYILATTHYGISLSAKFDTLLWALISCLGANIFIVGLNQITDIEIDRINKPELPLASGTLAVTHAKWITGISLLVSVAIAGVQGPFLFMTVLISLIIGSIYSLPPFRLKRFYFWAAASIFTIRGIVVNLLMFLHFSSFLDAQPTIPFHIWILTGFFFGLSLVIAWFKDIPDVQGDRLFQIRTLSVVIGSNKVFYLGLGVLTLWMVGLIYFSVVGLGELNGFILGIGNLVLLGALWLKGLKTTPTRKKLMREYYQFLWRIFFLEYILFALSAFRW